MSQCMGLESYRWPHACRFGVSQRMRGSLGCPFSLQSLVRFWKQLFEQVSLKLYDGYLQMLWVSLADKSNLVKWTLTSQKSQVPISPFCLCVFQFLRENSFLIAFEIFTFVKDCLLQIAHCHCLHIATILWNYVVLPKAYCKTLANRIKHSSNKIYIIIL